tara:strand:+ start:248 stop:772 length:525 start_codon:yes stop_codon:yes gene_type:complete
MTTAPTAPNAEERVEEEPVYEEGFTPVSHVTVIKKNQRYVGVATKNLKMDELVEKGGYAPIPYKTNEPDRRVKALAGFLPVIPCTCDQCKIMGPTLAIPTGNVIFVQFSRQPNINIKLNQEQGTFEMRAVTPIKKGDELYVDYSALYTQDILEGEALYENPNSLFSDNMSMQGR